MCLVVCVKVLKEELKFVDFSHKISEIATISKKNTESSLLWSLKFTINEKNWACVYTTVGSLF